MNHHSNPTPPISEQAFAAAVLIALAETYPTLPAPMITLHSCDSQLHLQLSRPHEFEEWRDALVVPTERVELKERDGAAWLAVDTAHRGVRIRLTGFGVVLPALVSLVRAA